MLLLPKYGIACSRWLLLCSFCLVFGGLSDFLSALSSLQVILDVVYNHTNEADDKNPYTTSFRGIDNKVIIMCILLKLLHGCAIIVIFRLQVRLILSHLLL